MTTVTGPASEISVVEKSNGRFTVEVRTAKSVTTHEVTVPDGYPAILGCGDATAADLVAASFAFLLEREPSTSILRRFELPQIADYFADYPDSVSRYLD